MIPPTTIPTGAMVFNHAVSHNGPALLSLVALALVAGLAGGAMVGMLIYSKVKTPWA